jgi:phage nucleotide-binding protein
LPKKNEIFDINIQSVDSLERDRNFLFYGRAGTGKTSLFATFPGPRLLLDVNDRGTDSIRGTGSDMIEVDSWGLLQAIYWDIVEHPDKYKKYKTIGVDTITEMQTLCIKNILKKYHKNEDRAGDWGTMSKKLWGEVSQSMKAEITNWRNIEKTIVFIAQDRMSKEGDEDNDADSDIMPEIGPSLSPAIAKTVGAAVDVIGNTFIRRNIRKVGKEEKEEIQYCLRIGPHPICLTKVRKPKEVTVPAVIVNPTYDDIVDIVKGE